MKTTYPKPIVNSDIVNLIYPVGSIYMSVNSTSPATLFGGTWSRLSGRFLLGATDGGSSGASQAAGNTGGVSTVTLSEANLPAISGWADFRKIASNSGTVGGSIIDAGGKFSQANASTGNATVTKSAADPTSVVKQRLTLSFGKSSPTAINNMPPYLSVYMWKRTA